MKEILLICIIVLVLYLYKSYNDIDNKLLLLEKQNRELKLEIKRLTIDYNQLKIRQVNWYSQIFTNEIPIEQEEEQ